MSYTLSELITEVRSLINQTDSNNSTFTDAVIKGWINEGQNFFADRLSFCPEQTRDFTPSASDITYTGGDLISVIAAYFYFPSSTDWNKLELLGTIDLNNLYPNHYNEDAGDPSCLIRTGANTFKLYPAPDAANISGGTLRIIALENPVALTNLTDVSSLPVSCHYLLPHYAAFRCFKQMGMEEAATQSISLCTSALKEMKYRITNTRGMHSATAKFYQFDD